MYVLPEWEKKLSDFKSDKGFVLLLIVVLRKKGKIFKYGTTQNVAFKDLEWEGYGRRERRQKKKEQLNKILLKDNLIIQQPKEKIKECKKPQDQNLGRITKNSEKEQFTSILEEQNKINID